MVVSFIAPHSLSARALVIAPDDVLTLHSSSRETLAVSVALMDALPEGFAGTVGANDEIVVSVVRA